MCSSFESYCVSKGGVLHADISIILDEKDRIRTSGQVERIVNARIPPPLLIAMKDRRA